MWTKTRTLNYLWICSMIQSTPVNFTTLTDRSNQSRYDNPNDVDLAIVALNGFVCGQNVIRVQKLGAAGQGWRACFCSGENMWKQWGVGKVWCQQIENATLVDGNSSWVQNLKDTWWSDMAVERDPPFFGSSLARSEPAVHQLINCPSPCREILTPRRWTSNGQMPVLRRLISSRLDPSRGDPMWCSRAILVRS